MTRPDASSLSAGTPDHVEVSQGGLADCWSNSAPEVRAKTCTWSRGRDPRIPLAWHAGPARTHCAAGAARRWHTALAAPRPRMSLLPVRSDRIFSDGSAELVYAPVWAHYARPAGSTATAASSPVTERIVFAALGVRVLASDVTRVTYAPAVPETAICARVGIAAYTPGTRWPADTREALNIGHLTDVSHCKLHQYLCCNREIKCQRK